MALQFASRPTVTIIVFVLSLPHWNLGKKKLNILGGFVDCELFYSNAASVTMAVVRHTASYGRV